MAKISAHGCYALAKWTGPIRRDEKYPETAYQDVVVLRSDGTVLLKTNLQHRPGERWSMGRYTTWHRFGAMKGLSRKDRHIVEKKHAILRARARVLHKYFVGKLGYRLTDRFPLVAELDTLDMSSQEVQE